jgi:hypothetical protein
MAERSELAGDVVASPIGITLKYGELVVSAELGVIVVRRW